MRLLYGLLFIIVMMADGLADGQVIHKKLPLSETLPLLQQIDDAALRMGSGPVKVYVFVDPLCPHSRNFVEMIAESDKMRARYSYFFYLYTLKRMHSERVVESIYMSKKPLEAFLAVMLRHQELRPVSKVSPEVQKKIEKIEAVGVKIDAYKRPYLIMVKKPKQKRGH